ncbi:uncharacterized protein LOC112346910 [Selaginella moellendorffii]|uniref:uncharacterized protein LOC112346910 n=1 Tax=Selaginella moellendorffii TaxID=88036 RepID=UPI000D1CC2D5|nr:uncharacterized protein LOC112346910 [Selaginella moellendorffii]|eukprot:XP_024532570.1 uncharacterized protein LOC112346910 [Selaginella moellendorffii]
MESSGSGEAHPSGQSFSRSISLPLFFLRFYLKFIFLFECIFTGSYEGDSPPPSYIPSNRQRQRRNREQLPGSQEALQAAQEYQQQLPRNSRSTVKVLNQCCVSGTFVMTLPSNYCKKMMPRGRAPVLVRDKSGHQWVMKWNWTMQPVIGAGWKAFCVHHELVKGDVLVFQKENISSKTITFHVEIFKRRKFANGTVIMNNGTNMALPLPKKEEELEIEIEELDGGATGEDVHDHDVLKRNPGRPKRTRRPPRREWMENSPSCDQDDEERGTGGAEEQREPVVALVFKKTRSAAESEELGVTVKMHGSKLERMTKSLLGSPGVIVQGSFDGSLKAKASEEELRKILRLAFPHYDAF